jgi:hypothetical protein
MALPVCSTLLGAWTAYLGVFILDSIMADVPTFGHLAKIITRTVVREGARRGPEVGEMP